MTAEKDRLTDRQTNQQAYGQDRETDRYIQHAF